MTHLTMEQLLALRGPGAEPGSAAAAAHLDSCADCRAELDRLHQRVARLKALPALRSPRDRLPQVMARARQERRGRQIRWGGLAGLALAASLALAVGLTGGSTALPADSGELVAAMAESRLLEQALRELDPSARVTDGHTERMAAALSDRIALVDRQLEAVQLSEVARREQALLRLWQERVGLMDALVNVHLTRASRVGL